MRIFRMALLLVLALGVVHAQPPAERVFVGARLVDGTGAKPIENAVVVVRGDRIAQVATMSEPGTIRETAERVDVRGRTIMPGFINAHGHVAGTKGLKSAPEFNTRENVERQLKLYASYGVTSVYSLGDDGPPGAAIRTEPPVGRARLFIAGPVISATTADAAAADVEKVAALGVDWLKFRVDDTLGTAKKMPKEAWKTVIERGHARKIPVAAHMFYLDDAKDLLREGIDVLAHSVRDKPIDEEFVRLAKERDVCLVPTLTREVSTFVYESTPAWFTDAFFLKHADTAAVEQLKDSKRQEAMRTSTSAQKYKVALEMASANLKKMKDAGMRVAFGTDSGPPARFQGYFEHMELELMVKAGLTPMDAIVSATGDAARCMKNTTGLGTLKAGAPADFVIYREDPTKDIRATRSIESVWVAGAKIQ
jgi:imidazolonepropionase-like amidohydrolase